MFAMLPESASASPARRSAAGLLWSAVAHVGVGALATLAGSMSVPPTPLEAAAAEDTVIWIPISPPRTSTGEGGAPPSDGSTTPSIGPSLPPAPLTVPYRIPPIDPAGPVFDDDAVSRDAERRLGGGHAGPGGNDAVWDAYRGYAARPERVAIAHPDNPRPRYPDALRAAAVEGSVVAEFVVDTNGAIALGSVRVLESDHPSFTDAVRAVLPRLRFQPAESGGRKVRQWVRVPFVFRLERNGARRSADERSWTANLSA